jgi:ubiquinone/menaquinone biosynthesis C-methylase UbiE
VLMRRLRRAILMRLFNSLYDLGQWIYDPLTVIFFGKAWHNWRRTVLPWVSEGPVLELACGTGQLLPELSERSRFVVGLEVSDSMLIAARKKAGLTQVQVTQGDAFALPFATESFETVVSTFPAGFITRREVLDEIARVLKPGGAFVVVVSARFTRFQWKRPFIHPILRLAYGSAESMNRWSDDLLNHPALPGEWQDLRTPEGEAFAWVARKAQ